MTNNLWQRKDSYFEIGFFSWNTSAAWVYRDSKPPSLCWGKIQTKLLPQSELLKTLVKWAMSLKSDLPPLVPPPPSLTTLPPSPSLDLSFISRQLPLRLQRILILAPLCLDAFHLVWSQHRPSNCQTWQRCLRRFSFGRASSETIPQL